MTVAEAENYIRSHCVPSRTRTEVIEFIRDLARGNAKPPVLVTSLRPKEEPLTLSPPPPGCPICLSPLVESYGRGLICPFCEENG